MRVYLPATITTLRLLLDTGELSALPMTAFAVTPDLREWYRDGDEEELEYAAMSLAALASLRLLDADPFTLRRRVVIAAELRDECMIVRDDLDRGVVQIVLPVVLASVVSAHVDDPAAEPTTAAAATAMLAADLGDETAQDVVDDAAAFELSWYATQELAALVDLL